MPRAGIARTALRKTKKPLAIFLKFPPPDFLEVEKGVLVLRFAH
jgi:hypothetical protein